MILRWILWPPWKRSIYNARTVAWSLKMVIYSWMQWMHWTKRQPDRPIQVRKKCEKSIRRNAGKIGAGNIVRAASSQASKRSPNHQRKRHGIRVQPVRRSTKNLRRPMQRLHQIWSPISLRHRHCDARTRTRRPHRTTTVPHEAIFDRVPVPVCVRLWTMVKMDPAMNCRHFL